MKEKHATVYSFWLHINSGNLLNVKPLLRQSSFIVQLHENPRDRVDKLALKIVFHACSLSASKSLLRFVGSYDITSKAPSCT